jgi:hypothetical protein
MWAVCGGSVLLSIPFLRWMRTSEADRRKLRAEAQGAGA